MPPVADDSGTLEGSRYVREDSAPPSGIDMNVREVFHVFFFFLYHTSHRRIVDPASSTYLAPPKAESWDRCTRLRVTIDR